MLGKAAFDAKLASVGPSHEKIAAFGALLSKAVGSRHAITIVGGSAIQIRTRGEYVSEDVDVVGLRARIEPILTRWGFRAELDPDGRRYWSRDELGLAIDLIDRSDYSGHTEGLLVVETPFGPVRVAAAEDLILRRLVLWKRDGRAELLDQAVLLYLDERSNLDLEYLAAHVRYEGVQDAYDEMLRLARSVDPT